MLFVTDPGRHEDMMYEREKKKRGFLASAQRFLAEVPPPPNTEDCAKIPTS